jgi:hypothetical protein
MELPDLLNAVFVGAVCYVVVRVGQWLIRRVSSQHGQGS